MLVMTAFFWGTTFIAQSSAMKDIGPFAFSAFRSIIGAAVLFLWYVITKRKNAFVPFSKANIKTTITGGVTCGVLMFIAANLQNVGLVNASPGKAAFITALYILIVPLIGLFFGKRPGKIVLMCCIVSIVGFYFLNITPSEGFNLTVWEIVILLCAFAFSFHIIACEHFGGKVDTVILSCIQFAVTSLLSFAFMFLDVTLLGFEMPSLQILSKTAFSIIYAAVFSSAIAYTLQIAGQKRVPATAAVLIMSLESVFAVAAAWIINPKENALTPVQLLGCTLILASICVAQIPFGRKKDTETSE